MAYSDEFILHLEELAHIYIEECLNHKKEMISNKGDIVLVLDRHIPTIDYFLRIWIPIVRKDKSIHRDTYYTWLNSDDQTQIRHYQKNRRPFQGLSQWTLLAMRAREYSMQRTGSACMIGSNLRPRM
jgi:hypothetical protein